MVQKLGGVLGLSVGHDGPSLEGACFGGVVLALGESGKGVNLETGVLVGKPLRGAVGFVGVNNLKDKKHNTCHCYKYKILPTHGSHRWPIRDHVSAVGA